MHNFASRPLALALLSGAFAGALALSGQAFAADEKKAPKEMTGQELAFDASKGNCLACHMIAGGDQPGTMGPPLIAMKARYPDRAALFEVVWDPRKKFPHTAMPPIGAYGILSKDEVNKVVDFVWGL